MHYISVLIDRMHAGAPFLQNARQILSTVTVFVKTARPWRASRRADQTDAHRRVKETESRSSKCERFQD